MRQIVEVRRLLDGGRCEVWMRRETACGGSCATCGGCGEVGAAIAVARNTAGAQPGDIAEIEAKPATILGGAAVTYLLPAALSIVGGVTLGTRGEGWAALGFFVGLVVGAAILVATGRLRRKRELLEIVRVVSLPMSSE